jgi:hypothetical protein
MAIENKENPDEGTPRSKKDIRKERRQMRETNRYRKSVGGEPLYSKQEIKDVEKPFKAEPGKALSGTIGGVTYNDPNKPAVSETTYEYQRAGGGKEKGIEPTTITKEQATALNSEDVNTGAKVREAIEAKAANNPNATMNDIKTAQEIGKETEEEINTKEKQIDQEVSQQTGQNGFKMTLDLSDEEGKEKIAPTTNAGDGSTVNKVVSGVPEGETNWTNVTTYGDGYQLPSDEDINARASQAKKKVPQLVIEKLGVQDYYPEIGRDIAVGTFTGSRIGSQTIYSGAGGLLPLGLYDARKRAIATEIKRKEALMDQLKEIPEISKQFQPYFSGQYVEGLNKFVNAYKDNPDGLMNDPEFRKFQAHYKSIGENFLKVDGELKKFSELLQPKDGGTAAYATPGMLEIERKFKSGFLPDKIEDWFSGKKNISYLSETVRALPNGYSWADKKVELLIKEGEAEIPIYPKDGVDWRDPKVKEAVERDVNGLVVSLKDGSPDYETYLTSLRKYFKFDFETMADEWIKGNSLDALTDKEKEEYRKSLATYMLSNMPPDSIVNKVEMQANQEAKRIGDQLDYQAKMNDIAAENWRFQKEYEKHNSATYGQIQAMEESGIKETALGVANPVVGAKSTMDKEYEVWMVDTKGKWRQDFVPAKEIMDANERAKEKGKSGMYFSDKGKSAFNVPDSGYFGVTQNVIKKEGTNYNGQQYGVMFNKVFNQNTQEDEYVPNKVRFRTSKTTIVQNGVRVKAAEQTYNVSAGQNPAWQMADTEGRGGKITQSEGGGSLIKKNN